MITRKLPAAGLGLVALMHVVLLVGALASPRAAAVHALATAGALAAAGGFLALHRRGGLAALAAGLGLLLGSAIVLLATGGGMLLPGAAAAGFALALAAAVAWAIRPSREPVARATLVRFGLAIAGVAAFAEMAAAISTRPLDAILALAVGAVGWALAAPNVDAEPAHASWRPRPKNPKADAKPDAPRDDAPA